MRARPETPAPAAAPAGDSHKIESIMTREVVSLPPDTPLPVLFEALRSARQCGAVICEKRVPIGIVSERDVVRVVARARSADSFAQGVAADIMTAPAFALNASEGWSDVLAMLRKRGFRRVPVVDDAGLLIGIVTLGDLLDAHTQALTAQRDALEHTVGQRTRELQELNAKLREQSFEDALLGIGNRRAMDAALEERHASAMRYRNVYSVVLADVDHFKAYNDHYGHTEADGVLRQLAQAMKKSLRTADRVYRYGGEEFVAVLPETDAPGALRAAERLRQAVEALGIEHEAAAGGLVTVSCGVSTADRSADSPDAPLHIITRADRALYVAKDAGRNRVRVAD